MAKIERYEAGKVSFLNSKCYSVIEEIEFSTYRYGIETEVDFFIYSGIYIRSYNKEFRDFVCDLDRAYEQIDSVNIPSPTDEQIKVVLNKIAEIENISPEELNSIKVGISNARKSALTKYSAPSASLEKKTPATEEDQETLSLESSNSGIKI